MAENRTEKWEVISPETGIIDDKVLSEEDIKKAEELLLYHEGDFSTGESIEYGVVLNDYSAGWGFTKKAFYSVDSFGTKIVIPYKGLIDQSEIATSVKGELILYCLKIHADEQWKRNANGLKREDVVVIYSMKSNEKNAYILTKLKEHFKKYLKK